MKKALVLDDINSDYSKYITSNGFEVVPVKDYVDNINLVPDLVVFTGGTDVNPELYEEKRIRTTGRPDTKRDKFEEQVFAQAKFLNIPMFGICRG